MVSATACGGETISTGESVNIPLFSGKDVFHQIAQGPKAAITMWACTDFQDLFTVLLQPAMPLLALPVRVIQKIVQTQVNGHL